MIGCSFRLWRAAARHEGNSGASPLILPTVQPARIARNREVNMRSLPLVAVLVVSAANAQTQLTVYNQNFAAVKENRTLELSQGENEVRVTDITAHLEPESVVLRELRQPDSIRILEQNYESDPLSEGLLLRKSEGKLLDFEITIRNQPEYGTLSNPKVWVMLEFKNSKKSHLGMPLPKGKVKVYRRDVDARNEFIGEDQIDHTPEDETVRLYTGNAFDLVGERRQTNFKLDTNARMADESFEIKVRNHKKERAKVRVVEHMYRWVQWAITDSSMDHTKTDARTIEFRPVIEAGGQAMITYTVHYTW